MLEWLSSKISHITHFGKEKGKGEKGIFVHCGWGCELVQPIKKTIWRFFKKIKIELPYDPEIPHLSVSQ